MMMVARFLLRESGALIRGESNTDYIATTLSDLKDDSRIVDN